jgi:hypothetical protein
VAEARITRQSGTTITVFTIVTIIFLPASFMAAFFALPIAEYPFVDEVFHLSYAVKWTVSVTAAVATPLIILALYVNPILAFIRHLGRIVRGVMKAAAKVTKAIFKIIKTVLTSIKSNLRGPVKLIPILLSLTILFPLLVCLGSKRIFQWSKDYRAAKKETIEKGEAWSKRRYIIGGFLQRRLEKKKVMDEEKQNRESERIESGLRSSMTSRSASLVESQNDPRTQRTGLEY